MFMKRNFGATFKTLGPTGPSRGAPSSETVLAHARALFAKCYNDTSVRVIYSCLTSPAKSTNPGP